MFWCRDIGLAKRLLGYSVWLLGVAWQLAITILQRLLVSMNDINQLPRLCDIQNGRYLCEFWLLRCSTMVARAWPVSVEVIQDWLLAARVNEPTSCFYDTLSWDIPLISFNGSLWDVLLRCSKWLLGAWLDSFTMILRCWLVVWVKWAAPLSLWHCDPELCSIEKRFQVNGATLGRLAPQGCKFYPLCGMFLQSPSASSNVANFTFLRNPLSELWVCEFWLLRWSTMVARAWPVCGGDSGLAACCPESNEPTLMFLWHFYPEISLWSLSMEVYGTCC